MPHDTDGGDIIKYHVTLIKRERSLASELTIT